MLLTSLHIKNYRSLEDVKLEGLRQFNALIGRNNAGKSSVFRALDLLNKVLSRVNPNSIEFGRTLTNNDNTRSLEIQLVFDLQIQDREDFFNILRKQIDEERINHLRTSRFLQQAEFVFKAPIGEPHFLRLTTTRIVAEDGKWVTIQELLDSENPSKPKHYKSFAILFNHVLKQNFHSILNSALLDRKTSGLNAQREIGYHENIPILWESDDAVNWIFRCPETYLRSSFFFDPFRHSAASLPAESNLTLDQDGSNLAQVLFTLNNNARPVFQNIEDFVQTAIPDIGMLQTTVNHTTTQIHFFPPEVGHSVRLTEMGGGIEQLLMTATVLFTTAQQNPLFLEEPESHLHAGAQRFLLEKLYEGGRQIFISTHSPIFINVAKPQSVVFQVTRSAGKTTITSRSDAAALSSVLEDVGVRNSDVLLSDAVVFVEGPGDKDALLAWSEKLGKNLEEYNVTILTMGGGEYADRSAPIRSQVLTDISQKSPVPHLFVIDRDQRRIDDIAKLEQRLEGKIHVLHARELENYLLVPRAILEAIRVKCETDAKIQAQLNQTSVADIEQIIRDATNGLFQAVLIKRVRTELGGLQGGFLTKEATEALINEPDHGELARKISQAVEAQVKPYTAKQRIAQIVRAQKRTLEVDWANADERQTTAPGEEILEAVYQRFGLRYKKGKDTMRIIQAMREDEINVEIVQLIDRAIALTGRL